MDRLQERLRTGLSSMLNDAQGIVTLTLLTFAIGYLAYTLYTYAQRQTSRKAFKLKNGCQPQTSIYPGLDPFGVIFTLKIVTSASKHRLLAFLHETHEKFGRTVFLDGGFIGAGAVFTVDPENIKCVLSTKFDDWSVKEVRQKPTKPLLGEGIFTTDGAFWSHSRAMLRPAFEKSQVADLSQFEDHVGALLQNIPTDGKTVDLQDLFHRFSMDASSELLIGQSTQSLLDQEDSEANQFGKNFEIGMADAISRGRLGKWYYLMPRFKAAKAIKFCRRFVDGYVENALKSKSSASTEKGSSEKFVFLDELAKHEEVDGARIRNEALNILLAGRDTTASLMSDLWFMLAREPEVFKKLQAEVDELGGELPTYERLRDMKYIKYCAQETLRLFPPVPFLSKKAIRDTVVPHGGGEDGLQPAFVPKGAELIYNMRSMMRQKSTYGPDAETFRPERWAESSLRPGWNFLPFGGGPRVCLGQQYALTECYYVTIRLMQHFRKIEDRDGTPWREKMTVTCCSLNGTQVALTR